VKRRQWAGSPLAAVAPIALVLAGCGGARPGQTAKTEAHPVAQAPSNPVALERMVKGVQAAKDGRRDDALAALREAVQIDPKLW
jgi:hypothetical protein